MNTPLIVSIQYLRIYDGHGFDNEIEKDFILYLQKELDLSITEEYLKRNVSEAISIKKVDNVITSFFNVYYVSVE